VSLDENHCTVWCIQWLRARSYCASPILQSTANGIFLHPLKVDVASRLTIDSPGSFYRTRKTWPPTWTGIFFYPTLTMSLQSRTRRIPDVSPASTRWSCSCLWKMSLSNRKRRLGLDSKMKMARSLNWRNKTNTRKIGLDSRRWIVQENCLLRFYRVNM